MCECGSSASRVRVWGLPRLRSGRWRGRHGADQPRPCLGNGCEARANILSWHDQQGAPWHVRRSLQEQVCLLKRDSQADIPCSKGKSGEREHAALALPF